MVRDLTKVTSCTRHGGAADHCEDEAQGAGQEVLQVGRGGVDRGLRLLSEFSLHSMSSFLFKVK